MAELQNANPTILNLSELPTRRRQKQGHRRPDDDLTTFSPRPPHWEKVLQETYEGFESKSVSDSSDAEDPIDEQEIFDLISTISDPEHPLTLGQLAVVNLPDIRLDPSPAPGVGPSLDTVTTVTVQLTPTVNHCSLATIIGLAVRVRLESCLPPNYRVDVCMKDGSHAQDDQVNKQLADKERVAAALENDTLKRTLDTMMETCISGYAKNIDSD
ncbi:putative fam96b-like protein [Diaporthe ampelina]|uniref:Putative fam96b-like protein n=1 Tax=Diaporthe ampelina TaxID=1214573 RepID=A0A0G2HRK9_9PEZI|nr:putative fam96b-like protein [Diaporthe ampelina]